MKCKNCGYEFEKPNLKSCPLCGSRITLDDEPEDDKDVSVEADIIPPRPISVEEETTVNLDVLEKQETQEAQNIMPEVKVNYCEPPMQTPEPVGKAPANNSFPEDRVIPEDPNQYVENGSYQPYPDEPEEEPSYDEEPYGQSVEKKSKTWLFVTVAAVVGILIGSIIYYSIQ